LTTHADCFVIAKLGFQNLIAKYSLKQPAASNCQLFTQFQMVFSILLPIIHSNGIQHLIANYSFKWPSAFNCQLFIHTSFYI